MKVFISVGADAYPLTDPLYATPKNILSKVQAARIYDVRAPKWAYVIRSLADSVDKAELLKRAAYHGAEEALLQKKWSGLVDAAWKKLTGKKWQVSDYKVSAVGRDEFSEDVKAELRDINNNINAHSNLAFICAQAAKKGPKKPGIYP
jgi:hypothetical protein